MDIVIAIVAVVVVLGLGALLVVRRRRPVATDVVRDTAAKAAGGDPLDRGLAKTRRSLGDRLGSLLGRGIDEALWVDLEEALIAADVGVTASMAVVQRVRAREPEDASAARRALREELLAVFGDREREIVLGGTPAVVLVVGVNGSGKTTTIAKLGARLQATGTRVVLGAADTFRAAASEQLQTWAERLDLGIVVGQEGADPASVAFDAYRSATARGAGAVVVDTAGRLHAKQNLMDELGKVGRVLRREAGDLDEVLLVLDGTTGQNGIAQARAFTAAIGVTGVVITKLDGSARGGIAVAVEEELGIPVKFVGVGEGVDDLVPFDPEDFVDALVGEP
ncbi:MAG: signal recognition particle-docking protein FtsY [Acidimicrobiia bacterium]|nr:signal recognition particle-docking protein FtsY [Acidimicrobiia bacterium]